MKQIGDRDGSGSPSPQEVKRGGKRFALSDGPDEFVPSLRAARTLVPSDVLPEAPLLSVDSLSSPSQVSRTKNQILSDEDEDDDEENDVVNEAGSEDDEWLPSTRAKHSRTSDSENEKRALGPPSKIAKAEDDTESDASLTSASASARKLTASATSTRPPTTIPRHAIFLGQEDSLDEPAIVPNRKAYSGVIGSDTGIGGRVYVPDVGEPGAVKKKKR